MITHDDFLNHKNVANKIINLLCKENLSSIHDIEIIYHIIRGYPYCLDCEGHYIYDGQYYNCMEELPLDALQQLCNSK